MDYLPPLQDQRFALNQVALAAIFRLPPFAEGSLELADAILVEAAKFAQEVLAPLNRVGDVGSRWQDGHVTTPPGFKEAWQQFAKLGWLSLRSPIEYGGQGLPTVLAVAIDEMWCSANLAFSLVPMLTLGAIETISAHGSELIKQRFLPALIRAEWTAAMDLTEPAAGSDLAAVRVLAQPQADGSYLLTGQKIFITWGEHDLAANIVHMVLARIEGAPAGVKGLSLFVVPKYHVRSEGSLGERNDVRCLSIEHKLGINASPTALISFGDQGQALGFLVGEPHCGLAHMFTMMNTARLGVAVEGLGLSERAYQSAFQYASTRVQGRLLGAADKTSVPLICHADIQRMLMSMKARICAQRLLTYYTAALLDEARGHPDESMRQARQQYANFLIPIIKTVNSEQAVKISSLALQIHGGMGYIEETGVAQYYRDARITPIYEGTTGIQALDLIGRKTASDQGRVAHALLDEVRMTVKALQPLDVAIFSQALASAVDHAQAAVHYIVQTFSLAPQTVAAGALPYLKLMGMVLGSWQLARALIASHPQPDLYPTYRIVAQFTAEHILVHSMALAKIVTQGGESVLAFGRNIS